MAGRAVVGRGDLLRALARVGGSAQEADDARCADRLGFDPWKVAPLDKPALQKADGGLSPGSVRPKGHEPQPTPERVPLHIQHFVVVKDEQLSPPPPDEDSGGDGASEAESETLEARSTPPRSPPAHVDLVPFSRLLPRLLGELGGEKCAGLDVPEAVGQAARGLPWARAPRRWRGAWPASWLVVLDLSDRVRPYWLDMHRLAARLQSECGAQSCQVRVLRQPGDPTGGWDDWVQHQPQQSAGLSRERQVPEPGQKVLLLSDLGGGANLRDAVTARRWQRWIGALPKAVRVVALSPAGLLCREAEPDRSLHRSTGWRKGTSDDVNAQALQQLLALCAPALRIEPRLLRELRLLLGESGLDGSLEAAVWNHPDLHAGPIACVWNETRREAHAATFRNLPVRLQRRAGEVLRRHHSGLSDFVGHEETLRWLACASDRVVPEGEVRKARQHFRAFSQGLEHTAAQRIGDVRSYAKRLLLRAPGLDESGLAALGLPRLAAWAWQDELRRGEPVPVPDGVSYEELVLLADGRLDEDAAAYGLMLVGGVLCLERVNPFMKGFRIATIRAARYLDWCCSDDGRRQVVALNQARIELCRLTWNQLPDLDFRTAGQHLVVQAMERPSWAKSWMRSRTGVFATIDSPWGSSWNIPLDADSDISWFVGPANTSADVGWGVGRDEYGCFSDLSIKGISQRLRYIEPGTFLMGSPDTEPGRYSDEGPCHQVTLTEGYWLADTTCTQTLWQAVMGNNPSHFKGDRDLPVDSVSWNDAQEFLKKLNGLLPSGCEAALPTEAQWEYACRAGTKTQYWFGESISAELAHFGQPFGSGRTVPVKARPANGWGLYQMHGNVREWCEGSLRKYEGVPVENPPDGQDKISRALRGGMWYGPAGDARSASRGGGHRHDDILDFGFRFSLRSIKPSQGLVKGSGGAAAKRVSRQVFISYAHADNLPMGEDVPGWVSAFVGKLQRTMGRHYGHYGSGEIEFWMDSHLEPQRRVGDELRRILRDSAVILVVMSPRYLDSVWCQREMATFVQELGGGVSADRVFMVELLPTERSRWHAEVQNLSAVKFWRNGLTQPEPQTLGWPLPDARGDRDYWAEVNTLAARLVRQLQALPAEPPPPDGPLMNAPQVYRMSAMDFSRRTFPDPFPPDCATAWGDDRFGLWFDLEIGGVTQRMRWIEPGTFCMGSPETEPNRDADEGPRHLVTLTEGYWLADTACTQAFWKAVVGDAPSHFKADPELPVENVIWDDITEKFLPAVQQQVSDLTVALPTEAQWEYACRAARESAYWFGDTITKEQANFDAKATVPVKARPANGWGLYQMHGNVLEWCEGGLRKFEEAPVENPPDGQDQYSRALRGGSWGAPAGHVRSACRLVFPRDLRSQHFGFRFSLRSIKPGQGIQAGGAR